MKKLILIFLVTISMTSFAFAGHQGIPPQGCTNCHIPNLVTQHGGFSSMTCWLCHSSTDINVINTIARGGTVYCSDCHGTATHTEKHSTYLSGWMAYPGIEPGSAPLWTQVTNFTVVDPAQKEYQLCFKCHSYYSFGELPNGVTDIVGPSGFNLTDQAMEFNPANKSAHPVEVSLNNQTGSYAPRALTSSQMSFLWTNVGNQMIQCSDCHDVANVTGPQGSSYQFTLKGTGKYWPTKSDGTTLWRLNTTDASDTNLFCKNCHPIYDGGGGGWGGLGGWKNKVHDLGRHNGYACVECHLAVPHGGKRSRLIVYASDPAPYKWDNYGTITQFKKASDPNNYDRSDCKAGCSRRHDSSVSNPDP